MKKNDDSVRLANAIKEAGGKAYLVGGCVRDYIIDPSSEPLDIDLEVYGLTRVELEKVLSEFQEVCYVGKSFGVYKFKDIDISLPRKDIQAKVLTENKLIHISVENSVYIPEIKVEYPHFKIVQSKNIRFKHKDYIVVCDPFMDKEKALKRRDFTMNALMFDPIDNILIDPFNGQKDIEDKTIRAVDKEVFNQDSLRVFRAIQFAGRFEYTIEKKTIDLCKSADLSVLPLERIYWEFKKLLMLSKRPSVGLKYFEELGVFNIFPEFEEMKNCPVNKVKHSVENVWEHTISVVDEAAKIKEKSSEPEMLMWSALLHDVCKAKEGKHGVCGERFAVNMVLKLSGGKKLAKGVGKMIRYHSKPKKMINSPLCEYRLLATKVSLKELYLLFTCDRLSSNIDKEKAQNEIDIFYSNCIKSGSFTKAQEPYITGRKLIDMGVVPGKNMGKIIKKLYSQQLKEDLSEEELIKIVKEKYIE